VCQTDPRVIYLRSMGDEDSQADETQRCIGCCCESEESVLTEDVEEDVFEKADAIVAEVIELRHKLNRKVDERNLKTGREYLNQAKEYAEQVRQKMKEFKEFTDKFTEPSGVSKFTSGTLDHPWLSREPLDVMILAAGPRTAEFLRCFYIRINAQDHKGVLAHRRFQYGGTPTKMARGPLEILDTAEQDERFFEYVAKSHPEAPKCTLNWEPPRMKEYEFRWLFLDSVVDCFGPYEEKIKHFKWNPVNYLQANDTTRGATLLQGRELEDKDATNLDSSEDEDKDEDSAADASLQVSRLRHMLSSFLKVDNDQYVFETVPAQILMLRTDQATWVQYLISFSLSAACLICLVFFTKWWNMEPDYYHCLERGAVYEGSCASMYLVYGIFLVCSIIELLVLISDWAIMKSQWLTFWNLISMVLAAFTSTVLLLIVSTPFVDPKENVWVLPALNATRWMKFTLLLLYWPSIGLRAMPAILAVFSSQSCTIFSLIVMAGLASTHTYFGFRVLENGVTFGQWGLWGVWTCFMRMSRVLLFAEGDVDELAGRLEAISAEGSSTLIDAEDVGPWGEVGKFDNYIEFINLFTLLTLIFGVLLMNTYVGVLSDTYSELNAHRLHYFQAWRGQWQMQALHRRELWATKMPQVGQLPPVKSWDFGGTDYRKGLWIVSAPRQVDDVRELDYKIEGIEEDIDEMKESIREIKNLLLVQSDPMKLSFSPLFQSRPMR